MHIQLKKKNSTNEKKTLYFELDFENNLLLINVIVESSGRE